MEETDTESRKSFIVYAESGETRLQAQEKTDCRCILAKTIAWKTFKTIVLFICLIFVVIQTIEFYNIYSEYPTNMVQKSAVFNKVKFPAVTICFKNTVSTKKFCYDNPDWCESPKNLEEFCKIHPIHCKGDTSNLTIPMTGYYTNNSRKLEEILKNYLFNDAFDDPYLYQKSRSFSETRTFVSSGDLIYKCYSHNLHLYQSGSQLNTEEVEFNTVHGYGFRHLELYRIELFGLPDEPQAFLGVHSPFVPINPVHDGHAIRSGYSYEIGVQLEKEEHLLPPPYQTNCRENGPSKDAKNFTNPNSYEMCLEMCESEMARALFGCDTGLIMASSPSDFCLRIISKSILDERELREKHLSCAQNCRPGCMNLYYNYQFGEFKRPGKQDDGITDIQINFSNRKVTLQSHVPLYSDGALISHIGGLLAYWLGISVFTSLDIIEKFYGRAVICWTGFRRNKVQQTTTYEKSPLKYLYLLYSSLTFKPTTQESIEISSDKISLIQTE